MLRRIEDVTRHKQVEEQLAEALDFNRKIISDAPAGIVVFKSTGECVMANEAAARIAQGTVPQMLKQDFRQLESWRASGLLETAEKTLATQKSQHEEFYSANAFGKETWLVGHFDSFVRNIEPHLVVTLNDITERKWAEDRLQEYEKVVEGSDEMVSVVDRNYRYVLANRAYHNA